METYQVLPRLHDDLEAIQKRWDGCTKCRIGTIANKQAFVDYIGDVGEHAHSRVDILMVGEGPGRGEDALGVPFIGPAGKLLREAIEQHSLAGILIGITNLVLCRPCDSRGGPNRAPDQLEIENCSPRLADMISIMRPTLLVTLGRVAEENIGGNYPRERIWFLHHPAYLLRIGGKESAEYERYVERIGTIINRTRIYKERDDIARTVRHS